MKNITILSIIAIAAMQSTQVKAQGKNYAFTIPNNTTMKHEDKSAKEFSDVYTVHTDSTNAAMSFILSITAIKTEDGTTMDQVMSQSFEDGFLKKCSCSITTSTPVTYEHFKGVRYDVKYNINGVAISGYTINTAVDGTLFSISIVIPGNVGIEARLPEFNRILNSMKFLE